MVPNIELSFYCCDIKGRSLSLKDIKDAHFHISGQDTQLTRVSAALRRFDLGFSPCEESELRRFIFDQQFIINLPGQERRLSLQIIKTKEGVEGLLGEFIDETSELWLQENNIRLMTGKPWAVMYTFNGSLEIIQPSACQVIREMNLTDMDRLLSLNMVFTDYEMAEMIGQIMEAKPHLGELLKSHPSLNENKGYRQQ